MERRYSRLQLDGKRDEVKLKQATLAIVHHVLQRL